MYSCGPVLMCGSCNGTVKQCEVKEQSIYRPTDAICDIPFVTYMYCYMFRHRGAILRDSSQQTYISNITIYVLILTRRICYVTNGVSQIASVGRYIDCSLTSYCFTVPLQLPHINTGPQLYMMSPLLCHLVLSIVHCSAALCVCYMWQCVM